MDRTLLPKVRAGSEERVDTLVDPVELVSSSHMPVAPRDGGATPRAARSAQGDAPRASFPSIDPDAQVQWFSRVFQDEPATSLDVEVSWDDEDDADPTLVLRRRTHS